MVLFLNWCLNVEVDHAYYVLSFALSQVYESNHDTILSAGSIEGPCEVLPPRTFNEETERRTRLGSPLYICKYAMFSSFIS